MSARFRLAAFIPAFLLAACGSAAAQESESAPINEDELFGDTVTVVHDSSLVSSDTAVREVSGAKKSVGFSGEVTSAVTLGLPREWTDSLDHIQESLTSFAVANLMIDVRLMNGIKAFGNLETQYASSGSNLLVDLRELFVDGHINYRVYLRAGKQVLQWGRCHLFNPTDLINVEKKLFIPKIGYREGTYGLRIHVPFGTVMNLYGFIDTRGADAIDEMAGAAKMEFLAGGTEFAFSLWGKRRWESVGAFDFSTRLGTFDIAGEASLSYGDNYDRLTIVHDTIVATRTDDLWMPRVALSVSRYFTVQGVPDRLMVVGECYYNHAGYVKNGFADTREYAFREPVAAEGSAPGSGEIVSGTRRLFLERKSLYEMNNYSKYYAALFTQFNRFITSDMNLTFNAIGNIAQKSALLTAGLNYSSINDFFMNVLFMAFIGPENTEYTFRDGAMTVRVSAGLVF